MRRALRELRVEIARRPVEPQHTDVLQQAGQENVLGLPDLGELAERASGRRGQEGAAPEAGIINARGVQSSEGGNERKAQRQRQCRVEPDDDERLTEILAWPALGIEGRIRD